VVFDVEGVIAHANVAAADRGLARHWPGVTYEAVETARNTDLLYPLWEDYSRGRVTPDTYWGAVLAALGITPTGAAVAAMRALQEATAWAVLDAGVLDIVQRIGATGKVRVGVLSNSAEDYESAIARFEALFDHTCFSHRTGRRKPHADAYLDAAHALDVSPTTVVFIDDKPRNLAGAEAVGMRAILFVDAPLLARDLTVLGLLPVGA
jgi:putative hydrolase of the HAD superfamily